MLNELVEFGKRIRKVDAHDALKEELINMDIVLDPQGNFRELIPVDKQPTLAEALQAKKGKARLLLDKAEEVLGLESKKHELFLQKLAQYRETPALLPVLRFYEDNKAQGLDKALDAFVQLPDKQRPKGNLAFRLTGETVRIHEKDEVRNAIIAVFEARQKTAVRSDGLLCSVCGTADYPIVDQPHGMIKKVPDGQSTGCALISYNENAFESYGLKGNNNATICTACARNYVEGLNYLLGNGVLYTPEKGKPYMQYSNRKSLSKDTAMIFWTRSLAPVPEIDYVDNAEEHTLDIASLLNGAPPSPTVLRDDALLLLLNSPFSGKNPSLHSVEPDHFYSCMLSGAAARIAVRNWIEATTSTVRDNLARWFHDIAVTEWDFTNKEMQVRFFPLGRLAGACGVHRKTERNGQIQYALDRDDDFLGRAAAMLWRCALLGDSPPRTLLDRVLRRVRLEEGRMTAARAALLKCILNRTQAQQHAGGIRMQPQLDQTNTTVAYTTGRIFAMLESIQSAALGNNLNAPIRDRFFSAASTCPASTFGRLIKLSQAHLSKLRGEKTNLARTLDKKLGELFTHLTAFPATFSLEEQGQFAIGYYHQRQANFTSAKSTDTDISDATETPTLSTGD